ncbi:MAG: DNA polymerase IV [Bacteroidota bacterium]|nr:DNA polymerase IV [Bacteroidota bacterium]
MERNVVHMDLDSFFVSVERLKNSRLNNMPVIIGGTSDRGVVSSCSYEARKFGVHSAMPAKMAHQLCPDAAFIKGDMDSYTKYSRLVTDIIASEAPAYEKASIDEHYLDITGMDKFFGSLKWTSKLRQKITRESGLPISFGLSVNKTVSKMATNEAKPNGQLMVESPKVRPFLNPLPIQKIPMLGTKTFQTLRAMGIADIRTLSNIPPEMLINLMGKSGKLLWERANGIDNTPVQQYSERKTIGTEHTFDADSMDIAAIHDLLSSMVEKLAFKIRKDHWLTSTVTVKIRYANFDTHSMQRRIAYTSFDHELMAVAHELFDKLYTRRMRLRLVGIKFSGLVHGVQQLRLFEAKPEMAKLYMAMDDIRKRFGKKAIRRAIGFH